MRKILNGSGVTGENLIHFFGKYTLLYNFYKHSRIYATGCWPSPFSLCECRKCWMIYRRPGFLAVVWLLADLPPSPTQVGYLSQTSCVTRGRTYLRRGGGRSQIIRPRESLDLCKSVNTLWAIDITITCLEEHSRQCEPSPPPHPSIREMPNWPSAHY
jgi:hypothetical protein